MCEGTFAYTGRSPDVGRVSFGVTKWGRSWNGGSDMAYWLTVHWPDTKHAEGYPAVWARGDTNTIADEIAVGDMVAIYETLNNEDEEPGCEPGAQAVILSGKVIRCYPAQEGDDFVLRAKLGEVIEREGASFQEITGDIVPGFSPNLRGLWRVDKEQFRLLTRQENIRVRVRGR